MTRYTLVRDALRHSVFILGLLYTAAPGVSQTTTAGQHGPVRIHSEAGWEIPELRRVLDGKPESQGTTEIGTVRVRYRTFAVSPADRKRMRTSRVLFLSHKGDTDYVSWHNLEPRSVSAYDAGGRVFAIIVEGVIRLEADPATGQGGTGGETRIAYQDVDGSGKLKLLLQKLPVDFRPEVPAWARR